MLISKHLNVPLFQIMYDSSFLSINFLKIETASFLTMLLNSSNHFKAYFTAAFYSQMIRYLP